MKKHLLLRGRLQLYRRPRSSYWQCATFIGGRHLRISTKQESFALAKDFAEDWYLGLKGKQQAGLLQSGRTFRDAAKQFEREYQVITEGQRSKKHVAMTFLRLRVHLIPYFGPLYLSEITAGKVQEYRVHRAETSKTGRPPSRSTLHQEIVALRQVLKTGQRHGWLTTVPDISPPYKASGKIVHRAWFSPAEYKQLYEATRRRADDPPNKRWRRECQRMHDYVLFMANTGLRPDEAARLEVRDVTVTYDRGTRERILEIEVRGKRGVGYCKSTKGAVLPFTRLCEREKLKGSARLFSGSQRELFNTILSELNLKHDRDGQRRTAYSLRHTYICLRLMEGADIYQIAKNCRTSVEMIEKYYAAHIKTSLDASAINVRRSAPSKRRRRASSPSGDSGHRRARSGHRTF